MFSAQKHLARLGVPQCSPQPEGLTFTASEPIGELSGEMILDIIQEDLKWSDSSRIASPTDYLDTRSHGASSFGASTHSGALCQRKRVYSLSTLLHLEQGADLRESHCRALQELHLWEPAQGSEIAKKRKAQGLQKKQRKQHSCPPTAAPFRTTLPHVPVSAPSQAPAPVAGLQADPVHTWRSHIESTHEQQRASEEASRADAWQKLAPKDLERASRTVYVMGLPLKTTDEQLLSHVRGNPDAPRNVVKYCVCGGDQPRYRTLFAFVEFATPAEAQQCTEELHLRLDSDCVLQCSIAKAPIHIGKTVGGKKGRRGGRAAAERRQHHQQQQQYAGASAGVRRSNGGPEVFG